MTKFSKFFYVLLAVFVTAGLSAWFVRIGITGWYQTFDKPFLTPPNMVFRSMWTILYGLLVVSMFNTLLKAKQQQLRGVWQTFLIQLGLQLLWCLAFFAEGLIGLGLLIIVLLDISAFQMIYSFWKINRWSGILLLPYGAWVLFATLLNILFAAQGQMIISF